MDKNNTPDKGLDTGQNNGLSDIQEVHYARVFTREEKTRNKYRKEMQTKSNIIYRRSSRALRKRGIPVVGNASCFIG